MQKASVFSLIAFALTACTGEPASKYFQLCLTSDADRRELETMLEQYSSDHGLKFSAATAKDKAWNRQVTGQSDPVSVYVKESGDHFVLVSNTAMGDEQIMISVFENQERKRTQLAEDLGRRLQERWDRVVITDGVGVQPLTECPYSPYPDIRSG